LVHWRCGVKMIDVRCDTCLRKKPCAATTCRCSTWTSTGSTAGATPARPTPGTASRGSPSATSSPCRCEPGTPASSTTGRINEPPGPPPVHLAVRAEGRVVHLRRRIPGAAGPTLPPTARVQRPKEPWGRLRLRLSLAGESEGKARRREGQALLQAGGLRPPQGTGKALA